MRLADLNPKWIGLHGWSSPAMFACGVTFRCPHCPPGERGVAGTSYLGVFFANPIDPLNIFPGFIYPYSDGKLWQRAGDTFETLTLSPSIDTSQHGHWHGFIENGEVR